MRNNRKLGKNQVKWLIALRDLGPWHRGACWWVGRQDSCVKVCESLVKRGLAYRDRTKQGQISGHGPEYKLTSQGRKKAMELVCTHASGQEPWRKDK